MTGTPALGIWRAHANVWRYIIDNNIQTALVIEDDVDFDVNIKEIMGMLNWQLRYNNTIRWGKDVEKGWKEECPYGTYRHTTVRIGSKLIVFFRLRLG